MTDKQPNILVAGAINTDLVATMMRAPMAGETITGTGFEIHGGGKGANQAVAVARSGGSVSLIGAIGNDDFGRNRIASLAEDAVDTTWIQVSGSASSGVALIFVETDGENRIAYVPGATLSVSPEHARKTIEAVKPTYLLATNELPREALLELMREAQNMGAEVILNATPDPETVDELLEFVNVLIVNEGEGQILLRSEEPLDPMVAVRRLAETGISKVVMTVGKDGAIVASDDAMERHPAPNVDVVDTTGAGDTFCGAFVAELARGVSVSEAVRFGVAASAISVTRKGAQSSIPTREEIAAS